MKDLLLVAKEATNQIREKYITVEEDFTEAQLMEIEFIITATYLKQSFFWKIQNPLKSYLNMVTLDLEYNFIGGGFVNPKGDTTIEIK